MIKPADKDQIVKDTNNEVSEETPIEKHHVMTLFGVPLEVASKKLATILKADVMDVLNADIGNIGQSASGKSESGGVAEQLEDKKAVHEPDRSTTIDNQAPRSVPVDSFSEFKSRIETIGETLGFTVEIGGVWHSPTDLILLVRYVEKECGSERAKKFVLSMSDQLKKITSECSGLFVVNDQLTCDVYKVAIKEKHLYSKVRVITYDNLNELLKLMHKKKLSHQQVATLLVPLQNIDVGELLNIIRATQLDDLII